MEQHVHHYLACRQRRDLGIGAPHFSQVALFFGLLPMLCMRGSLFARGKNGSGVPVGSGVGGRVLCAQWSCFISRLPAAKKSVASSLGTAIWGCHSRVKVETQNGVTF
jgi:hypothetical protein